MSRLAELIEQLCPDGVEYKSIGSFAQCVAGATPNSKDPSLWDGNIPWMSSGEVNKRIIRSTDRCITQRGFDSCSTKMIPAGAVVVALAGQGKTRGTVARTRIELCTNQSLCAIISDANVDSDFLFHYLVSQYNNLRAVSSGDGTRGGLNLKMIREYRVPVPPLEVQREIVRILDQFTTLEAELEAELEARRAQYEHYRNHLLSYESLVARGPVNVIELQDVGVVRMCKRIHKAETSVQGDIPFFKISTFGGTPTSFISVELYEKYKEKYPYPKQGDLLISAAGTIGQIVRFDGADAYFQDSNIVWLEHDESIVLNRYLYYVYLNTRWTTDGGTIKRLYNNRILQQQICVPPIETQIAIADLLDRFDTLVNDITSGLPAEIAARRAQYEHYRDRLLSFPEKVVSVSDAS